MVLPKSSEKVLKFTIFISLNSIWFDFQTVLNRVLSLINNTKRALSVLNIKPGIFNEFVKSSKIIAEQMFSIRINVRFDINQ